MIICLVSIIKSQLNSENNYAPSAGYYSGGLLSLADDGLDSEIFLNLQNKFGLYSNIWIGQIDYYSDTDVVSDLTLGFNKNILKNISFDLGLSGNTTFSNPPQTIYEYFMGIDINNIAFYVFFAQDVTALEFWLKPKINSFIALNWDLLLHSYFESDGYEISCNISKQIREKLIGGIIIGYESFVNELSDQNKDDTKYYTPSITYSKIFINAYLGFLHH